MRCDGLVGYIYEWYGDRVYGPDDNWDVSLSSAWIQNLHIGDAITPKSQAQQYLKRMATDLP